jgi:endonuclease III
MKNATKHADDLKALCRRLVKDQKPEPRQSQDPLQALVRGAMSYDVSDSRANDAMRAMEREFVDLNEMRVGTELEVQDLLGQRYPAIEQRVTLITAALNRIFEKEHTLSLDRLKALSKRDARQFLRDLPEMLPFVEAYVMIYAFDGHAFPIDNEMLTYFREQKIVDEDTSMEDAQKFVENHLKAEDCYDLFVSIRRVLWDEKKRKK